MIPDAIGEIEGYRLWKLEGNNKVNLFSTIVPGAWVPGVNEARCKPLTGAPRLIETEYRNGPAGGLIREEMYNHHGPIPEEKCQCGFWLMKEPAELVRRHFNIDIRRFAGQVMRGAVVGKVKAWGRIVVGNLGYRCEYAQIDHLCLPTEPFDEYASDKDVHRIAEVYDVPVVMDERFNVLQEVSKWTDWPEFEWGR